MSGPKRKKLKWHRVGQNWWLGFVRRPDGYSDKYEVIDRDEYVAANTRLDNIGCFGSIDEAMAACEMEAGDKCEDPENHNCPDCGVAMYWAKKRPDAGPGRRGPGYVCPECGWGCACREFES